MPNLLDIRRRIKSVKNTQQITSAMELIAASRILKAQMQVAAATPYANVITDVVGHLAGAELMPLATLAGHLTVFVVLLVCLRAVGISAEEVSAIEAFAAWSLIRILGVIPLTPAGLGFVELGLTGALVAFGASNTDAVAATLLYRALTVLPTLALGALAAATWRTHHPGERLESPG